MSKQINEAAAAIEEIETTIGELIEAIAVIAEEFGRSEQEGYELAAITLGRILGQRGRGSVYSEWN